MAKVSLRKYNSEIESLIERGQTDEAIAHCRHILKTFPKHLDTYRLMGKAFLESKHYPEATDIFERVLMAVPDDFVSHVGLSIIADEGKQLDDAIWHMERAFEKQPSNAAIQAELQRLYGRRDGREPPKIRLTRGALAHMYYQGELHTQAISEIRSVLAEDPNRIDLQSLLALAYFRAGQKVEASEACSQILAQFPYCLDANRILVEILPGTGMAESLETYRQRVVELDPYAAHVRGSIFQSTDAPDNAISLERLDYKGQPVEISPEWSQSLGIGLGAAAASSAQPDWLKTEPPTEPVASRPPESAAPAFRFEEPVKESQPPASGGDFIPEWMREAGWGESTGAFDESAAPVSEEPAEGELAKADLPDWIKSMAPVEPVPSTASTAEETDEDTMDWLNKLSGDKPFGSEQSTPLDEFPKAEASTAASDVQDWLSSLDQPAPAPKATPEAGLADMPDWLTNLGKPAQEAAPAEPSAETPAWITDLGKPAQEAAPVEPAIEAPDWLSDLETPAEAIKPSNESADWLSKLDETPKEIPSIEPSAPVEPAAPISPIAEAGIGSLGTSAAEQDAAMLWLESLAAKQGAKSEELITNPEERLEKPPEWVEQAKAVGESQPQPAVAAPEEAEPPAVQEVAPVQEEIEPVSLEPTSMDQTGIWMRDLETQEPQPEQPVEAGPAAWSGEIEIAPPPAGPDAESAPEADLPSWLRGMETREVPPVPSSAEEIPDWLKGEEPETPVHPEPTRPADWSPEPQKVTPRPAVTEPKPEPRKAAVRKPETKTKPLTEAAASDRTKVRRTGVLPPLIDPSLASARDAMSRGKIPDALQSYGQLIRKGKLLEDVTFDLKEALYRFPVEVSIWQALGDAYMRANRLQDALDAYTKAEELLR